MASAAPRGGELTYGHALALALLVVLLACGELEPAGCLTSPDPRCVPPTACAGLRYECARPAPTLRVMTAGDAPPSGLHARARPGDVVLQNGLVTAVIAAIDHAHYQAPSGGNLLDLAPAGGDDHLNLVFTTTGLLPRDALRYESLELLAGDDAVAVVARGSLEGDDRVRVVTRYELGRCDPGLRVRTEVFNGGRALASWYLADAWYWGEQTLATLAPVRGENFRPPPLDLLAPDAAFRTLPWLSASSHGARPVSYAITACARAALTAIRLGSFSGLGVPRAIVRPGDGLAFERMVFTAAGDGVDGAQSLAVQAHARLHGGATSTLRGRLVAAGLPFGGDARTATVMAWEPAPDAPDDPDRGTIWSETSAASDGRFSLTVPRGRALRVQSVRFGRAHGAPRHVTPDAADTPLGDLAVSPVATLEVRVVDARGRPTPAELIVRSTAPDASRDRAVTSAHGAATASCAPLLGPPHGPSPACNRVLAHDGAARFAAPAGAWDVYATAGLASTLARARVTALEGEVTGVTLTLTRLEGLLPDGALSADLHVHGGRSYDSDLPDADRVRSFVAAGVDVLVASDHDVVADYAPAVAALGPDARVTVLAGVEASPLILHLRGPATSSRASWGTSTSGPSRRPSSRCRPSRGPSPGRSSTACGRAFATARWCSSTTR